MRVKKRERRHIPLSRLLSGFLAMVMLMSLFSGAVFATGEGNLGSVPDPEMGLYTAVTTIDGVETVDPDSELSKRSEDKPISLDTKLFLHLKWENIEDITFEDVVSDDGSVVKVCRATYQIPEFLTLPVQSFSEPIVPDGAFADKEGTTPFKDEVARLEIAEGSRDINMTFYDKTFYIEAVETHTRYLHDLNFTFDFSLNQSGLTPNDEGVVTIQLPYCDKSYTVKVTELMPKGPELTKAALGEVNGDGVVNWKITYTAPTTTYAGIEGNELNIPVRLVDQLPAGMEYKGDFQYSPGPSDPDADELFTLKEDPDPDNHQLVFTIGALEPEETYELTYSTRLTDAARMALWSEEKRADKTYANTVWGEYTKGSPINGLSSSAAAGMDQAVWKNGGFISKDGQLLSVKVDGTNQYYVAWKVVVHTAGCKFQYLDLVDTMGAGLTLITSDENVGDKTTGVIVNGGSPLAPAAGDTPAVGEYQLTEEGGKHVMRVPLVKNDFAVQEYTIEYMTWVDPDYFNQPNDGSTAPEEYSNSATLEWAWPDGVDGPTPPIPTVVKGPGEGIPNFDNRLIAKAARGFAPETLEVKWQVTVNPKKIDLRTITLTEDLTLRDGVANYFEHSFTRNEVAGDCTAIDMDSAMADLKLAVEAGLRAAEMDVSDAGAKVEVSYTDEKHAEIKITGLSESKTFSFEFVTYVDDPNFAPWANVSGKKCYNQVTLKEATVGDSGTPVKSGITAEKDQEIGTIVLTKAGEAYDPESKLLTWKIEVNKNKLPLSDGELTITDTIPAGMTYHSANITPVGGMERPLLAEGEGADGWVPGNEVKFHIDAAELRDGATIRVVTSVDVNAAQFWATNTVTLSNTVTLTGAQLGDGTVSANKTVTMQNIPLRKEQFLSGTDVDKDKIVEYTVKLNPLGVDLGRGLGEDKVLRLTDKLSEGLLLDRTSVKLYEGETTVALNGTTTLEKKLDVPPMEWNDPRLSFACDTKNNSFSINVPDHEKPYVITYTAYVTKANVVLKNEVSLTGQVDFVNKSDHSVQTHRYSVKKGVKFGLPSTAAANFYVLSVEKVGMNGKTLWDVPGVLVDGADACTFELYKADKTTQLAVGTVSSSDGLCKFVLPVGMPGDVGNGDILWLKETKAPQGYQENPNFIKVQVDLTAGRTEDGQEVQVRNVPKPAEGQPDPAKSGSITVTKVETGVDTPINGAVFGLYLDPDCAQPAQVEDGQGDGQNRLTTRENGQAVFKGLYPDAPYYVREESVPAPYILDQTPQLVKASVADDADSGKVTFENQRTQSITVTKVETGTDTPIEGAVFGLYEDADCARAVRVEGGHGGAGNLLTTNEHGTLSFNGLNPGGSYHVREESVPAPYILDTTPRRVSVSVSGNADSGKLLVENQRTQSITVTKVETGTDTPIEGAVFGLYEDADCARAVRVEGGQGDGQNLLTTNEHGTLSFNGLNPGGSYYVREESVPAPYILDPTPRQVSVSVSGDADSGKLLVENQRTQSITVTKVETGVNTPIKGAVFGLYRDSACTQAVRVEGGHGSAGNLLTTNEHGTLSFNGLNPGGSYYVREESVPAPYILDTTPRPANASVSGNADSGKLTVENDRAQAVIEVTKVDSGDNTKLLAGAEFKLYLGDTLVDSQTTDDTGKARFTGLWPNTTYILKETKAPNGYLVFKEYKDGKAVTTGGNDPGDPLALMVANVKQSSGDGGGWTPGGGSGGTTDPNDPNKPVDPNDPNKPVDPNDPNKPVDPNDPNKPVDPNDPNKPVDPNDPNKPVDPNDPNKPVDPNDPNKPVDPNDPNKPVDPNDPNKPVDPNDPNKPVGPNDPNGSNGTGGNISDGDGDGSEQSSSSIPDTGVSDRTPLWASGMVLCLGVAVFFLARGRKKHNDR